MSDAEFDLISFAAGTVKGARSFKIDKLGRLTGINYPQVWTPGENLAKCLAGGMRPSLAGTVGFRTYRLGDVARYDQTGNSYVTYDGTPIPAALYQSVASVPNGAGTFTVPVVQTAANLPADVAETEHGMAGCLHGFYAYYDGSDDYHKPGMASAVVEGYGESLIGTRGFRCMKAKIIALTINPDVPKPLADLVARNYKDVTRFPSFESMVKAVPPDPAGMEPSSDSDPDFWTRSI